MPFHHSTLHSNSFVLRPQLVHAAGYFVGVVAASVTCVIVSSGTRMLVAWSAGGERSVSLMSTSLSVRMVTACGVSMSLNKAVALSNFPTSRTPALL